MQGQLLAAALLLTVLGHGGPALLTKPSGQAAGLMQMCWVAGWQERRMLLSCFLIKNEQNHTSSGSAGGERGEPGALQNISLRGAGSRQSCSHVMDVDRGQEEHL